MIPIAAGRIGRLGSAEAGRTGRLGSAEPRPIRQRLESSWSMRSLGSSSIGNDLDLMRRHADRLGDDTVHCPLKPARYARFHAKLDELFRSDANARAELTTLDEKEPKAIEEHRDAEVRAMNRAK